MKSIYKYLLSLAVSATILPACRDEANQVVEQGVAKKHSRTLQVSTPDEAGGARAMLVANQGTKDFYVHWSAGDKVQIFCQQGQHFLDLGSFPLEHIAEDKRSAQLNISYPDVIDLEKPYMLYGVYGAAAKYTPIGQSVGGKHTADEGLVFDASPIIGKPVADFRPPLYFKQKINPKVSGNALQFAHYGTYEIVKMENASKQAVRVLAPQLASATNELWYAHLASNKSNLFLPSKGTTQEASLLAAHQTGAERTLQSGENRVFVNWYRPTDTPLTKAKLIATIDGVKQTSTERALPKAMKLQVGRAYHLTAVWDGKKLTYDQVEEEVNGKNIVWDQISSDDYELRADGLTLIDWKNPNTQNLDMNRDSRLRKITSIGNRAFMYCSGLTSINIPSSVASIEEQAFLGCSSLKSITIPSSVTSIEKYTFYDCSLLTSVTIPSSVRIIGNGAFKDCRSLTHIHIPSSVSSIGEQAFSGCSRLTSVTIPSSVTSIGERSFFYCYNLTNINISSSVTSIGASAFSYCHSLTSIHIPSSVTSIGSEAFQGCSGLTSINIPSSVTSIGSKAFGDCSSLTRVVFKGNKPPTNNHPVFVNTPSILKLIVPKGAKSAYIEAGYPEDKLVEE